MDRKTLESYQPLKRLIERNLKKIDDEKSKDIPVVSGKVQSSMSEFPYIETHVAVQMNEPIAADQSNRKIKKWQNEIDNAKIQIQTIEEFIDNIVDVKVREIFTYKYIDGVRITEIAYTIGYTKGRISQIISEYLKD